VLEIQDWLLNAVLQKVNLGEQFNLTDWSVCKANIEVKMLANKFLHSKTYHHLVYTFQKIIRSNTNNYADFYANRGLSNLCN